MEYKLNIAGYIIDVESSDFTLVPGKRFSSFIDPTDAPLSGAPPAPTDAPTAEVSASLKGGSSITIQVHTGLTELPQGAKCLFRAPYVEEVSGMRFEKDPEFWSIWKNNKNLFIKTTFPLTPGNKKGLLRFSLNTNEWDLWIDSPGEKSTDPLEYPLDGLILYYLSVINGNMMIHASGVSHNGKGYIFSGVSGKGKTTISGLWKNAGASLIHDDRLILRKIHGEFRMYNTPVYDDEKPSESRVDAVFLIEHGKENNSARLNGAAAISAVMSNCIQHNWGHQTISGLLQTVTELCSTVPVYNLSFKPDISVVDHVTKRMT